MNFKVFTEKQLMEILEVKETTIRKYREEGYIRYSKVNDKIWYTEDYILEFLNRNQYPPFRYENENETEQDTQHGLRA